MNTATDKQVAFIDSLVGSRIVSPEWLARVQQRKAEGLTKDTASKIIAALKTLDQKPREAVVIKTDVPSGRYAITFADGTKFYKVDNVTEGKWAGRTFVKHIAGDNEYPVRNNSQRASVLKAIAVNPEHSSKLYGQEIGSCGVCGRTLTDETSRANGIGPVCAANMGW